MLFTTLALMQKWTALFMNVTARLSLRLVPADLRSQPLFLCIDDTMVSKFGKKFEDVSKVTTGM